jgi:hypothetical protein
MNTVTEPVSLHPQVRSFVGASRKMLIGGLWLDAISGKTFATYNPATGDVLAQVAEAIVPTRIEPSSRHGRPSRTAPGVNLPPPNVAV